MEGYMAEIRMFSGDFAPRYWALCQGQLMAISSNSALFSLLGTTYGGNGTTTFALPDLRSRVPVGTGSGGGLTVELGEVGGETSHTLIQSEMPAHNHAATLTATSPASSASSTEVPSATVAPGPAALGAGVSKNFGTADANLAPPTVAAPTLGIAGSSSPHNNLQPYLGMKYIICTQGIYPSRN